MISKVRANDQEAHYEFLKSVFSGKTKLQNTKSLILVKQIKTEVVLS